MKLTGQDILKLGYKQGKEIGLALKIAETYPEKKQKQAKRDLKKVLKAPMNYLRKEPFAELAKELVSPSLKEAIVPLLDEKIAYKTFGKVQIEQGAIDQMETAMKLPVSKAGALMPDAHQGYGLPIGGVLATENAIIPYAVGVDIGCRMCMSIYDLPVSMLREEKRMFKDLLNVNTRFGRESFENSMDHEILEHQTFQDIAIVKTLKDRAAKQIGSSGGGNHFVEFGIVEITDENNEFDLPTGKYLGLLSHSGSRGMGAFIAKHYTNLAMQNCKLPKEAKHLAWLDMNKQEGQEYWLAMNLAGDYASACHHQIHERMEKSLQATTLAMVENHHNFAWKEMDQFGNERIVHRKGATPAGKGVLGVIPGSMTDPGFIVRGKGSILSLNSASHGAGRKMSRRKAESMLQKKDVKKFLKHHGVEVIGSGLDEAPMAYKDINEVMNYQSDLVDVIGTFQPKIVRMSKD
ncbi:RtcB family protein [Aureivirga sp. CE67]|uniref:RtcB family protein n=1 Tax=Aureivirga sp. CE67 TaxID=1788983 RepID=UPI0018CAA6FB|nr:RtcB family protein [Aureivirga sp. CE67]